jgi:hypothetical protein
MRNGTELVQTSSLPSNRHPAGNSTCWRCCAFAVTINMDITTVVPIAAARTKFAAPGKARWSAIFKKDLRGNVDRVFLYLGGASAFTRSYRLDAGDDGTEQVHRLISIVADRHGGYP